MRWGILTIIIGIVGVWCVYFASSIVGDGNLVVAIILTTFLAAAYPGYYAMLTIEETEYLQKHEYRYSSLERRVKELENKLENKDDY